MGKHKHNKKVINRELVIKQSFEPLFKEMWDKGIHFDNSLCDSKHSYVVHCWTRPEVKCSVFMKTLRFVPFGCIKGVSGQGIDNLKVFLDTFEYPKKEEQAKMLTYREKIEALKDVLLSIRDERNFEVVDKAIKDYCG